MVAAYTPGPAAPASDDGPVVIDLTGSQERQR